MRRSLVVRLLVAVVTVTVVAVVGTVWLTHTTRPTYSLARAEVTTTADFAIVDELLTWAGSHGDWEDAVPLVHRLALEHDRRVSVVAADGEVVVETHAGLPRPAHAHWEIDPWAQLVEERAGARTAADASVEETWSLPPHLAGALALTSQERADLAGRAAELAACLGVSVQDAFEVWPTGRPVLSARHEGTGCDTAPLETPVATERDALATLGELTTACLLDRGRDAVGPVVLAHEPGDRVVLAVGGDAPRPLLTGTPEAACVDDAFIEASAGTVAPPVDVFLTDERGDVRGVLDLSPGSVARIAAVSLGVLALVLATAWFIGVPAVRQVREVTGAARRLAAGDLTATVPVRGGDEVSELAAAFNTMSAELKAARDQQRRLTSDVAHELRTPLTTLRGWLEGAQDGVVPTDRRLVDLLHGETMHLQRIAADLHTLTLAESGRLEPRRDRVDLSGLLRDAVRSATLRATAEGIDVHADVDEGLEVTGDAERLRQVADNLLENALQHSGGRHVALRAARGADAVVIEVHDDGAGIPADELPHVFERFWRADRSRARESGGSGLGLAITRELVELHGGSVQVTSEPGAGSTFVVALPAGQRRRPAG